MKRHSGLFPQEHECELGADSVRLFGTESHTGAEPSLLLRVLRDGALEWRPLPQVPSDQQHSAAWSQEGCREDLQVRYTFSSSTPPLQPLQHHTFTHSFLRQAWLALIDLEDGHDNSFCSLYWQRPTDQTDAFVSRLHYRDLAGEKVSFCVCGFCAFNTTAC